MHTQDDISYFTGLEAKHEAVGDDVNVSLSYKPLPALGMSHSSICRVSSHQLLALLLVLHHLLDGRRIADLLHFGVFTLRFSFSGLCFRPLLPRSLHDSNHSLRLGLPLYAPSY